MGASDGMQEYVFAMQYATASVFVRGFTFLLCIAMLTAMKSMPNAISNAAAPSGKP